MKTINCNLNEFLSDDLAFIENAILLSRDYPVDVRDEFIKLNSNGTDVLTIFNNALSKGVDRYQSSYLLGEILPELPDISIDSFINCLETYCSENLQFIGNLIDPVKRWVESNSDKVYLLEKKLIESSTKNNFGFLVALFDCYIQVEGESVENKIFFYLESSDEYLVSIALKALGVNPYFTENKIEKYSNAIMHKIKEGNKVISSNSICLLTRKLIKNKGFYEILKNLIKTNDADVTSEVLNFLNQSFNEHDSISEELLKLILLGKIDNSHIQMRIDSLLFRFISEEKPIENVLDVIRMWAANENRLDDRFDKVFSMSIYKLVENRSKLSTVITNLFLEENYKYHSIAKDICSYLTSRGNNSLNLDVKVLNSLNYNEILYLVRKILGFLIDFDLTANLIHSTLKCENVDIELQSLCASVFVRHLGENYPRRMVKFSEEILAQDPTEEVRKVYEKVVKELELELKKLSDLKVNKSLMPKGQYSRAGNRYSNREMNKAMKRARDESPLLGSISNIMISEGKGSFSFFKGEYRDISLMHDISDSMEIPVNDVLDEVGALLERQGFRLSKKGAK